MKNNKDKVMSVRVSEEFETQLNHKLEMNNLKLGFLTRLFWREWLEGKLVVYSPKVEIVNEDETSFHRSDDTSDW